MHYRRIRGDMIEVYKILTGKYDVVAVPDLQRGTLFTTRGNNLRLVKSYAKYDLRKYYFTNRIANIWNSLPNYVVLADSTAAFETRLDRFWVNQDVVYDYRAEITGTGNRSIE